DKIDVLFDIDNSASMGDKQAYLAKAIPDLIARLVSPRCIDPNGEANGYGADPDGHCAEGTAEFPPVRDMHLGIVSSSLGGRLGAASVCPGSATLAVAGGGMMPRHNDDQGHLVARAADPTTSGGYGETPLAATGTAGFLDWAPGGAPPALSDPSTFTSDFQA